jgi:hypothetical protein
MKPEFLEDSYDIVKRFFCETLRSLGYESTSILFSLATGLGKRLTLSNFLE